MDRDERARLRALCEAATPGPWQAWWSPRPTVAYGIGPEDGPIAMTIAGSEADAELMAAARTALPALLDALDAVTRERDEARAEAADLRATVDTMQAQLDAHREWLATAQASGDDARAEAARLRALVGAAVDAERDACAVLCGKIGDAAEAERDACCDDRSRSLHAGRMHGADECARAIRARGAGGAR